MRGPKPPPQRFLKFPDLSLDESLALSRDDNHQLCLNSSDDGRSITGFYWKDGVVKAWINDGVHGSTFQGSTLSLNGSGIPETVIGALPDRRLGQLVDHPFIAAAPVIFKVSQAGDWIDLALMIAEMPISVNGDSQSTLTN